MVETVLAENPGEVAAYLEGKDGLINWFFGQVMRAARGKANPDVVRQALREQLGKRGDDQSGGS
jgi:aspartyl-tRNA(Asn)/glutamyl-tRNA(Gln) amidotransferase subunit B